MQQLCGQIGLSATQTPLRFVHSGKGLKQSCPMHENHAIISVDKLYASYYAGFHELGDSQKGSEQNEQK